MPLIEGREIVATGHIQDSGIIDHEFVLKVIPYEETVRAAEIADEQGILVFQQIDISLKAASLVVIACPSMIFLVADPDGQRQWELRIVFEAEQFWHDACLKYPFYEIIVVPIQIQRKQVQLRAVHPEEFQAASAESFNIGQGDELIDDQEVFLWAEFFPEVCQGLVKPDAPAFFLQQVEGIVLCGVYSELEEGDGRDAQIPEYAVQNAVLFIL